MNLPASNSPKTRPALNKKTPQKATKSQITLSKISKGIFLISSTILITLFIFLKVDLSEQNNILALVGVPQNTGIKYKQAEKQIELKEIANQKLKKQIQEYNLRLKEQRYSTKQDLIAKIKKQQKNWFDQKTIKTEGINEENILKIGILDIPKKAQDFFNAPEFFNNQGEKIEDRSILYDNQITIKNSSIQQNKLKISIHTKNLYGQVFFLGSSFVNALNQFPQLSQGKITNFRKKIEQNGQETAEFHIDFHINNIQDTNTEENKTQELSPFVKEFVEWNNQKSEIQNIANTNNIRRIRK